MNDSARPLFEAIGLGRMYGDGTKALDRVNLTAGKGEITAILGPPGCGKTTLLRMLAKLERPTAGMLDWPGGEPVDGETGYLFSDPSLLSWLTVRDNIQLPFRLRGTSGEDAGDLVQNATVLAGLEGFEDYLPHQLSAEMRTRVSLARALAPRPALLLIDEPFTATDEFTRFQLSDTLLRLHSTIGGTIVFATDSIYEAVYVSQKVAVMSPKPGRVIGAHPVDMPWPRMPDRRTSNIFIEHCHAITEILAGKIGE